MGKDRRKKDGSKKQTDTSVPSGVDSEPKAQRESRYRASHEHRQKECSKNVDDLLRNNVSDHTLSSSQSDSKPGE
jgi:hypothetical protein